MRTLGAIDNIEKERIAKETMEIYGSILDRMGGIESMNLKIIFWCSYLHKKMIKDRLDDIKEKSFKFRNLSRFSKFLIKIICNGRFRERYHFQYGENSKKKNIFRANYISFE